MKELDRKALRSEVAPERIDALWERLDQELVLTPPPWRRAVRWPLLAAACVGFLAGGLAFRAGTSAPSATAPPALAVPETQAPHLYAAGDSAKRFQLGDDVVIDLSPHTIVEYRATTRSVVLLRGQLILRHRRAPGVAQPASGVGIHLQIGQLHAHVNHAALRLRRLASIAEFQIERGTVLVQRRPNRPQPSGPTNPIRLTTGSTRHLPLFDAQPNLMAAAASPEQQAANDRLPPRDRPRPIEKPKQSPAPPAWVSACDRGDYQQAYEMVQGLPGGAQAVIPTLRSAKQLLCLSSGGQLKKDNEVAKIAAQRVIKEHEGDVNAMVAASDLERIHAAQGNHAEAAKYRLLKERLSKDTLLTADALCKKIRTKAKKGEHSAVITYAARYRQQYPGGACSQEIQHLVAQAQRARAEDDPYADSDDEVSKPPSDSGKAKTATSSQPAQPGATQKHPGSKQPRPGKAASDAAEPSPKDAKQSPGPKARPTKAVPAKRQQTGAGAKTKG